MEPLQIRVWWYRSRSFNLSSVLSWNVAMWTHTRQLDVFVLGEMFWWHIWWLFLFEEARFCWGDETKWVLFHVLLGEIPVFFPWSLVHRDRDMRIGMLLHLPGVPSKTTVFFVSKEPVSNLKCPCLKYVFRFFVDALRDWIQDTCLFDSSTRANKNTKWYI